MFIKAVVLPLIRSQLLEEYMKAQALCQKGNSRLIKSILSPSLCCLFLILFL